MKRYLIAAVVVMTVLAVSWVVFAKEGQKPAAQAPAAQAPAAQAPAGPGPGQGQGGGRGRGGFLSAEEQQKVIEAVEQQVAKLKESLKAQPTRPAGFQDLSQDERAKFMEQMTKAREERQAAIKIILTQLARLQGQAPAEGAEYIIVNTADLKTIQELATKEKATETADRIASILQPRRGMGGGRQGGPPGEGGAGQRQRGAGAGGQGG